MIRNESQSSIIKFQLMLQKSHSKVMYIILGIEIVKRGIIYYIVVNIIL